ncbi:MAG: hypothetical protein AAF721_20780 [Myxococcota bacterium]
MSDDPEARTRSAARGGPRGTFELAVDSLRCPCCKERFYFAKHAGRTWRTECPSVACAEVLVVSRAPSFRFRVERVGTHLRRVCPDSPGFVHYATDHWIEIAVAVALLLTVFPMLWMSATPVYDALLVLSVALSAALVCAFAFSLGARRWLHRQVRDDENRREAAQSLGRTPFISVSPTPGWLPE